MSYVVVGNSAAGLFAVEEIRRHDAESELIVLTAEQGPSYSRCLTTYFLAGEIPAAKLYLRDKDFAGRLNIKVFNGVKVNNIDPSRKIVQSTEGKEWNYSKLLLAMGASAKKLDIKGFNLPEVFTLRTLDDAVAINKILEQGAKKAVVIGGGLVSLKCACALRKRGQEVTVLVSSPQILSQMLNANAAGIIQRQLEANGLRFLLNTEAMEITGREHVQGVLPAPEKEIAAEMVIVGKGVQPNVGFLENCGFNIGRGLQADPYLATNIPNIFAAGDIAETWDIVRQKFTVNSTWPNATIQGRIAGANMCGKKEIYPGSLSLNSVDFFGLSAMSAGITKLPENKDQGEWHQTEDFKIVKNMPVYQNLIWQGHVLMGFALIGNTSQCGVLTALVKSGRPLTDIQKKMSRGKRGTLAVSMMYPFLN